MTFTRAGWAVAAAGPVLVTVGLLLGYPFITGAGLAALAAILFAVLATLVRYQVTASRSVTPAKVTVGGEVRMHLTVQNLRSLPTPGFVGVFHIGQDETLELTVPPLGPKGHASVSTVVTTARRGLMRLSPVAVRRRDPLGLAHRSAGFSGPDWLWVHPRVHQLKPLPAGLILDFEGRITNQSLRGSSTFAALREYQQGDDPRHIHWRTTARTGTLIVRQNVDTTEPTTSIVLDTRSDALSPSAFEEAVEAAASVAAASARAGRPFTLSAPSAPPAPGTQAPPESGYLDRLAMLQQQPGQIADLMTTIGMTPAGGALVVVSGEAQGLIATISRHRNRFAHVVIILIGETNGIVNRRPGITALSVRTASELVAHWPAVLAGSA